MTKSTMTKKGAIILLFAAFIVPVILAKFALENDWFSRGSTNKGELLQPVKDINAVLSDQPKRWRLLYTLPAECDAACQNAIYSIHQVWLALGKESDRAEVTVLITPESDANTTQQIATEKNIRAITTTNEKIKSLQLNTRGNEILLVDTLNNAMLRYDVHDDKQAAVMASRDILADLKKLLKLSRIG
ncbi:hypothetical protein OPS25_10865 [Alteromonas ponticola]|uniref:Uncharacterized protein n=1 Tax=Alteromonas aquimaris TaxID=2998417 RepID=A0ABT3P8D4_9ALTE|nr:hypothetical protein [Alteromonas aquimaris]MCW8108995.1 hypothetical protein [Alteromonas aquimaris]